MKARGQCVVFPPGFPFVSADIAVVAVVSQHLLVLVGDVRAHGRKPFQCVEGPGTLPVPGCIGDFGFPGKIGHPLLRKGRANDIPGQVFHGLGM